MSNASVVLAGKPGPCRRPWQFDGEAVKQVEQVNILWPAVLENHKEDPDEKPSVLVKHWWINLPTIPLISLQPKHCTHHNAWTIRAEPVCLAECEIADVLEAGQSDDPMHRNDDQKRFHQHEVRLTALSSGYCTAAAWWRANPTSFLSALCFSFCGFWSLLLC